MKEIIKSVLEWLQKLVGGTKTTPTKATQQVPVVPLVVPMENTKPTPMEKPMEEPKQPEPKPENKPNTMERKVIICLDNGHGAETPGKRSPWSANKVKPELPFREYAYCRMIVKELAQVLQEDGYDVRIIVPEDYDVTLANRGKRINAVVNEAKAKGWHTLCISVHNNAAGSGKEWKKAYGWSVWTTPGQTNSDKLAQCLYDAAVQVLTPLGQKTRKDHSDGDDDYEANFAMCRMPNCPAVLTENMFQDCVDEVKFLLSEEGHKAIVEIHHKGINKFVEDMGW